MKLPRNNLFWAVVFTTIFFAIFTALIYAAVTWNWFFITFISLLGIAVFIMTVVGIKGMMDVAEKEGK